MAITRKRRKTFSLSEDVVQFLESFRKETARDSMTSVVEAIVKERKRQHELAKLSASVSAYYDSLSTHQRREESSWGRFAESQLSAVDE